MPCRAVVALAAVAACAPVRDPNTCVAKELGRELPAVTVRACDPAVTDCAPLPPALGPASATGRITVTLRVVPGPNDPAGAADIDQFRALLLARLRCAAARSRGDMRNATDNSPE